MLTFHECNLKFRQSSQFDFEKELNSRLERDLYFLSQLKKPYIAFNDDEQQIFYNSALIFNFLLKLYKVRENSFNSDMRSWLWNVIPEGSRKNELRVKEKRIKMMLEEIMPTLPYDFNPL